ncbi:MAG: class II SORL domain-containing protein [Thermoplasmata archaeon]
MKRFGDMVYTGEKEGKEKHVPVIEAPKKVKAGQWFTVTVTVGKDVPHPNLVEHHIKWIQIYAQVDGRPYNPVHVATFDFGPTFADPSVTFRMKLDKKTTVYALGYCNVHGVWENSVEIEVE